MSINAAYTFIKDPLPTIPAACLLCYDSGTTVNLHMKISSKHAGRNRKIFSPYSRLTAKESVVLYITYWS